MTIIAALPTPPSRAYPGQFSEKTDAFLGALPGFVTETNAVAVEVNADKDTAVDSAALAVQKAVEAAASAAASAGDSIAAAWVSGTTYTIGKIVWSPLNLLSYARKTNGAGTIDPMSDPTNWTPRVPTQIYRQTRSSNTILAKADDRSVIDITSGTFSQTFSACATLGSGWSCTIRNSGTGLITLDPNGAETIDGLASFVMYPGESRLIQCDGSALNSLVIQGFRATFTTSATFVKPPGYSLFGMLLWGGGNSGQKNSGESYGGGGGGCFQFTVNTSAVAASESILIGDGGLAKTTTGNGLIGGSTSFGSLARVLSHPSQHYIGGSVVSAASEPTPVWDGAKAATGAADSGSSIYGAGSGGSVTSGVVRAAGGSLFGGVGGAASAAGSGTDGTAPGGGGGATQTGTQSGAGARGECRVWGVV